MRRPGEPLSRPDAQRDGPGAPISRGAAAAGALIARLVDKSWAIRRGVIAELASLGDGAVGPLCQVLRSQRDDETRLAAAVDALVASRGDVEPSVMRLIAESEAPAIVVDGVQILGRRKSVEAVPALVRLTSHPDDNVAMTAIEALGRIGGAAALDTLVAIVEGGNFFRTFPAIDVLGRSGDARAVAALEKLLESPLLAPEAARALGRSGDLAAIAPLAKLLERAAEALVRVAGLALADIHDRYSARFGSPERVEGAVRSAVDAAVASRRVCRSLAGADPAEQVALCRVLGWFDDGSAGSALVALLDANATVAAAARQALKRLGRDADVQLAAELQRADGARRLVLLPHIGSRAAPIEVVLRCLDDPDPAVRALACEALARIGNPAAVPALFERLGDADARVGQAVLGAIQSITAPMTEDLALAAARSPDASVRRAALRIVGYFGYARGLDVLIEAMADPDERLRDTATAGLPFIDDPRAIEALLAAAKHSSDRTRAAVMRALGNAREEPRVRPLLLAGLDDGDAWVRYYACQSLGKLGEVAATGAIVKLVRDPMGQVRVSAVEALAHLRGAEATAALQEAAASDEPDLRRAALVGLGIKQDEASLPLLLEAAESSDAATRLIAISALAGFAAGRALPALARGASDREASVREAALGHLATRPGAAAADLLIGLLANPSIRDRVVEALAVPVEGRIDQVFAALGTADPDRAPLLVAALARMHRPEARAAIAGALALSRPGRSTSSTSPRRSPPSGSTRYRRGSSRW